MDIGGLIVAFLLFKAFDNWEEDRAEREKIMKEAEEKLNNKLEGNRRELEEWAIAQAEKMEKGR